MSLADLHPDHHPTRRTLLKSAALAGAAALAPRISRAAQPAHVGAPDLAKSARAKNVIFMVADGMSFGTLTLGDMFIRQTRAKPGAWTELWKRRDVRRASAKTHALDSLVTDSAAGGCAWGSGRHINNGAINCLPDGEQLLPILIHAKQSGKSTGVVTTARVTHATPASFYANCPRRDFEAVIGTQLLERGIDVALGGGARSLPPDLPAGHTDLTVVRTREELAAATLHGRLIGLFDKTHVPFVLDRTEKIPSLIDMTLAALKRLEQNENGFVLQIEAGRVDHAAHSNDAPSLIREQVEFDDCIGAVLKWMQGRDDTLLIITTDHANANPGLTLYGPEGAAGMTLLTKARRSFDWIYDTIGPLKTKADIPAAVAAFGDKVLYAMDIELAASEIEMIGSCMNEQRVSPFHEANKWTSVLGAILADRFGVAFCSPNHTADYVEVTAIGPGSEDVGGLIDNIDLHGVMTRALGLGEGKLLDDMREPLKMSKPPKTD